MAEVFSGVQMVLEKLGSVAFREIRSASGIECDLKKLDHTLSNIKAMLLDAEQKHLDQNYGLSIWLRQLRNAFYDAEDLMDEFKCEALRKQVLESQGMSTIRKVHHCFLCYNPLVFRFRLGHKIKEIRKRFDEIAKDKSNFHLAQHHEEIRRGMEEKRDMTHSFVNALEVIGRDADKEEIIDSLMHQDNIGNLSVIAIVGFGGLGKTTLAKLVYNDARVSHFDLRMWVCVSEDFSISKLTKAILSSAINDRINEDLSIDQLQIRLQSVLKDKTFLLVLDDVWNDDRSKWIELRDLLTVGAKGGKIIVTTRNTSVASIMGTIPQYILKGLSDEDCLSLFFTCAFGNEKQEKQHPNLKEIGTQIVKKCRGVPLAVKTLGCLLYSKMDETEWKFVRDSEIWELERKDRHILPALKLSYNLIPSDLKQCFAYSSLFPKDYKIHSLKLISIWMALGILQSPNEKLELEDIGKLHFKELCARSFFQNVDASYFGHSYLCEMHDLVHDLVLSITKDECAIVNSTTKDISYSVRHLSFSDYSQNTLKILRKVNNLRTIMICNEQMESASQFEESFLSTCISKFKYLRVFDLKNSSFKVLPSSIGTLKHLRFLSLSGNRRIKKLPNSICKLQSLQTLSLGGCMKLEELPRDVNKLISLRNFTVTTIQKCFPNNGVGCLKVLSVLNICYCSNLTSLPSDMRNLTTLQDLVIIGCPQLDLETRAGQVFQLSLQKLVIFDLPKIETLPQWLVGSADTLQELCIEYCHNLAALPEWLPNLRSLKKFVIKQCPELSYLPDGMQRLTSLTDLRIEVCHNLEERCKRESGEDWSKIAHVPNIFIAS